MASKSVTDSLRISFFAPRGKHRIFGIGRQLAQLCLDPEDLLIGVIGDAGCGKSALVKGMFPGLELTNDDDGVNVRPLPLLDVGTEQGFFTPHTYHVDIRFEMALTQPHVLAEAITEAVRLGRRVIVEHFDLIYPLLGRNADLLIGIGEQIIVARPTMFGPDPQEFTAKTHSSLPFRLMAHSAEDLVEFVLPRELVEIANHDDISHGFILAFQDYRPQIDIAAVERKVNALIATDLPISYADEAHVRIGESLHPCTGPRTHVSHTGAIEGFRLCPELVFDKHQNRHLLIGFIGNDSAESLGNLKRHGIIR